MTDSPALMKWLRGVQPRGYSVSADTAMVALTNAFMEMDAALSSVQKAVGDYRAVTGKADLDSNWEAVRAQCDTATESYVGLTTPERLTPPTSNEVQLGIKILESASQALAGFKTNRSRALNEGAGAVANITASAQLAQTVAIASLNACAGLPAELQAYASVNNAKQSLQQAIARQRSADGYSEMVLSTQAVNNAAAQLTAAVQDAPSLGPRAKQALSSISSRIAAARTRLEGVKPAFSSLLREFLDSSSSDLTGNADAARNRINQATDCLTRARAADHQNDPVGALDLIKQARNELAVADQLIDAVSGRLRSLRELRDQPEKPAQAVRFALHDAQMYAESRHNAQKWIVMLDAQRQRVNHTESLLNAPHPDYWRYATDLEKIAESIKLIVSQMKGSKQ